MISRVKVIKKAKSWLRTGVIDDVRDLPLAEHLLMMSSQFLPSGTLGGGGGGGGGEVGLIITEDVLSRRESTLMSARLSKL